MKPYYKNELTTTYNGDCLEYLNSIEENKFDAIITDPPYLIDYKTNRRQYDNKFNDVIKNDNKVEHLPIIKEFIRLSYLKLKDDSVLAMFCSFDNVDIFKQQAELNGFNVKNIVIWDKGNHTAGDLQAQFGKQYEMIVIAHKGRCKFKNNYRFSDIWRIPRLNSDKQVHQNQKPEPLMQRLIEVFTKKDDLILDGFAGSFTTCISAEQLGRKSIGIELEQKYCDIGIKRLNSLQIKFDI
jgi:site-specific DNA-methyltransferase (adenine-specific)